MRHLLCQSEAEALAIIEEINNAKEYPNERIKTYTNPRETESGKFVVSLLDNDWGLLSYTNREKEVALPQDVKPIKLL